MSDPEPTTSNKVVGIIPARWGSTRFPGKPLHQIAGKALVHHVWERCQESTLLDRAVIATDDQSRFNAFCRANDLVPCAAPLVGLVKSRDAVCLE